MPAPNTCGVFIDQLAHGAVASNRGLWAVFPFGFGAIGLLLGLGPLVFGSSPSDRTIGLLLTASGASLVVVGMLVSRFLRKSDRRRATAPTSVQGVAFRDRTILWGSFQLQFSGALSRDNARPLESLSASEVTDVDASRATLVLAVTPYGVNLKHFHIVGIALAAGSDVLGAVHRGPSGLWYSRRAIRCIRCISATSPNPKR